MGEGMIMEVVKWFTGLFLIFMLVAIALVAIDVGAVNNYKQQVNYEIERSGGLTSDAIERLESYSEDNYGGHFKVQSEQAHQKVDFGETVDYTVDVDIAMRLFPVVPNLKVEVEGSGVSQTR